MLALSARRPSRAWLVLASLSLSACSLIGVEPDEIDFALGSETIGEAAETGGADESDDGAEQGMTTDSTSAGDGDGDPTTTGDGDGDADDGETGGDGDGDPHPCAELEPTPLSLGPNPIAIEAGASLVSGNCGHDGPEAVFSFTAELDVNLELSLTGFDAALYAIDGEICLPLVELACVNTPMTLSASVPAGQTAYFMVDAVDGTGGSGDLNLATVP